MDRGTKTAAVLRQTLAMVDIIGMVQICLGWCWWAWHRRLDFHKHFWNKTYLCWFGWDLVQHTDVDKVDIIGMV